MITFCFDRIANEHYGYPNLAQWSAEPYTPEWRNFDQQWPYSVPLRLLMYFRYNRIPYQMTTVDSATHAWYPIAFGWFDFACDYISLIHPTVIERVKQHYIKILFYYHEGDNPRQIKERLDYLCEMHALPDNCYVFISANSAAEDLEQCIYFPDHEFFFRHLNRQQQPENCITPKIYDFTALSRTHKWWRASCFADLYYSKMLTNSLWSYNTSVLIDDNVNDNPIELDSIGGWRDRVESFFAAGPYMCDNYNTNQQNDHHIVNEDLYRLSNIHLVFETHFDADQSDGTFLTEKTYKAIKYGQPFVIVGPVGSLKQLRHDGYCTFDDIIDNTYDQIEDNTKRWISVKNTIAQLLEIGTDKIFNQCCAGILHNQKTFLDRQKDPLNTLKSKLLCLLEK
jgi:hypothetical protein